MLVKLAWRNLWRQKRRTVLTASALALALVLSLVMRSMQEGTYANSIENSARFYTGLIQLQHPEYGESNSIDDLLPGSEDFIQPAKALPSMEFVMPRIESFALAAASDKSKGVLVIGIEPTLEDGYSNLSDKIVKGSYFSASDKAVLLGESLARVMNVTVGDEFVLYGQGYRGQTAAGLYTIKGLISFPTPQLESQLVYMPLEQAKLMYSTEGQVTNWVLHTKSLEQVSIATEQLKSIYKDNVNVRDWTDLSPETAQNIQMDKAGGIFLMYVLYGVVGFGLFATIMMMTLERQREFGVMLATGLVRSKLITLIGLESAMMALIGVVIGLVVSAPILAYLFYNPIELTGETAKLMIQSGLEPVIPIAIKTSLFIDQILIVLTLMLLCLIYPMKRIYQLELVSALKGGAHAH
ncbi:ABC transporter permease [Vibrio tapetis]|uniref:Putative ABC-type antimicrobial peptide transport system, permease component n=1 Tax=Vibrio tapetis subsp. tapetis TaxID=1671868 RepID=A0A2N8Z9Z8_9VIBR|nr:FtsX-like permease family protein [Vibrio tapetis]SON48728.1 putative ABC-type antimicrobial peptide transport system, permease component [Vibrio tapetis subsp. tapetis]